MSVDLQDILPAVPVAEELETWPEPLPLPESEQAAAAPHMTPDFLPEAFRPWLQDAAELIGVPLEAVAVPAIVAAGNAVGRTIGIIPKRHDTTWKVHPNLWGALVGRPGTKKSPAINAALKPLRHIENTLAAAFDADSAGREAERERLQLERDAKRGHLKRVLEGKGKPGETIDELQKAMAELQEQLDAVPEAPRRHVVNDPTVEKLGEILRDNPRGVLLLRDELSGFLATFTKPGREGDQDFYLEGWNGNQPYTTDRIQRGTIRIPHVTVGVFGSIQPGRLGRHVHAAVTESDKDSGLLQRFQLLVWPELPEQAPVDRAPDLAALDTAQQVFDWLAALEPETLALLPNDTGNAYLRFDPKEAQQLFDAWSAELEGRLRGNTLGSSPAFEAHLSKYRDLLPALALVFHLIDLGATAGGLPNAVNLKHAAMAAQWCEFLEAHARKLYQVELSRPATAAELLLEKIEAGQVKPGDSVRRIGRKGWAGLKSTDTIRQAIAVLEAHGYVRLVDVKPAAGGRPTQALQIHPAWCKS